MREGTKSVATTRRVPRWAVGVVLLWMLSRTVLVWLAVHPQGYWTSPPVTGDVSLYAWHAEQVIGERRLPYRDFALEYPPGSLPFILAPRALGFRGNAYLGAFAVEMTLVDLLGLAACFALSGRRRWWIPLAYAAATMPLGPIAYTRFDFVPAVAVLWAITLARRGRWAGAGALLGLGTAAKLYPAFVIPIFLIEAWRLGGTSREWKLRAARLVAGVTLVLLIAVAPFFLLARKGLEAGTIGYHGRRGVQVESLWGGLLLGKATKGYPATVAYKYGAFDVISPASNTLKAVSSALSVAILAGGSLAAGFAARRRRGDPAFLAGACLALLLALVATGKVLSPQYVLWLAVIAPAALAERDPWFTCTWALLLPAGFASQMLYPFLYYNLLAIESQPVLLLLARNGTLLAATAVAVVGLARKLPVQTKLPTPAGSVTGETGV
ncbi:MAG: glycosyltransferase 87 family protein [Actinomycetota bacterium]